MTHFTGAFSFVLPRSRRTLQTVKKILKKLLTNAAEDDIIIKLTHSRASSKMKTLQKILKKFKKVLTNDEECDILCKHSKLQSKHRSEKLNLLV